MENSGGAGGAVSLQKRGEMEIESPVLKQCREELYSSKNPFRHRPRITSGSPVSN